jgi:hypothetical protein
MSDPDEAAIDAEFERQLEQSTLNSPAAQYIRGMRDARALALRTVAVWLAERDGYVNITDATLAVRMIEADDLLDRLGFPNPPLEAGSEA